MGVDVVFVLKVVALQGSTGGGLHRDVHLSAEGAGEEEEDARRKVDGEIHEGEGVVGKAVCDGGVVGVEIRIVGKGEHARADVAGIAQHHRDDGAHHEARELILFERGALAEEAADAYHAECERIVQQELHGVDDVGVLKRLQAAVDEADDDAAARAEHAAIDHEGQEARERHAAALGKVDEARVGEGEGHCDGNGAVHYGAGVGEGRLLAEEERHAEDEDADHHGNDEPGGGKTRIPLALGSLEVSGHEHHRGDERAEKARARDDGCDLDREFVEEGRDAHKTSAAYRDAHEGEDGLEELVGRTAVVVVDLIERDHRHKHGAHDGETRDDAEGDFGVVFEPVATEAVHQNGDRKSEDGERHHRIKDGEAHVVEEPVEECGDRPVEFFGDGVRNVAAGAADHLVKLTVRELADIDRSVGSRKNAVDHSISSVKEFSSCAGNEKPRRMPGCSTKGIRLVCFLTRGLSHKLKGMISAFRHP